MEKDFSTVPAVITLTNKSEEPVGFRYYRVNFVEVIEAGDSVKITSPSSEEVAYYMALADAKVGLEVTKA